MSLGKGWAKGCLPSEALAKDGAFDDILDVKWS